jgi:hypothetical protein
MVSINRPPYFYSQKGRSSYGALATVFAAVLAALFLASHIWVIGVPLALLAISGIYAFAQGENWNISITDSLLAWSYPRWPKSSGRIDLNSVRTVTVDGCSSTLSFAFADGSTRKIKLIGNAHHFRNYLLAHFPNLKVEFVEGT